MGISPKVNLPRLEIELAYTDVTIQQASYYATGTPSHNIWNFTNLRGYTGMKTPIRAISRF